MREDAATSGYTTLIETDVLARHLDDPNWAIIDCRFFLNHPELGRKQYEDAHIPGAVYADLDHDLSGPVTPGQTGRHPLPDVATFAQKLGEWGIDNEVQVVAYDGAGGSIAARLWWMLNWMGHARVAVLNGDYRAWFHEQRPTRSGVEQRTPRTFTAHLHPELVISADEVMANLDNPRLKLLDARARDRFRGENETLDAKAGHIPGARSAPYAENVDSRGRFLPPEQLAERFQELLDGAPASDAVLYCGSGVTAAHNALAMAVAGVGTPRIYAGSWSDWITNPAHPIATGEEDQKAG